MVKPAAAILAALFVRTPAFGELHALVTPQATLTIGEPSIENTARGISVRGAICRRAFASVRPRHVRLDRIAADGALLRSRTTPIRGLPGYRGGCGFYAFHDAPLRDGETLRIAVRRAMRRSLL